MLMLCYAMPSFAADVSLTPYCHCRRFHALFSLLRVHADARRHTLTRCRYTRHDTLFMLIIRHAACLYSARYADFQRATLITRHCRLLRMPPFSIYLFR